MNGSERGGGPWEFYVGGVEDIRLFASLINLGTFTFYDEEKAIMVVRLDPAKLAEPLPEQVVASPRPQPRSGEPSASPFEESSPREPPFGLPGGPFPGRSGVGPGMSRGDAATPGPGVPMPGRGVRSGGFVPPGPQGPGGPGKKGELAGGSGGMAFHVARQGHPVLGFQYGTGSWAGKQALGLLHPVFERAVRPVPGHSVVAREGYEVGGLIVDAKDFVFAVKMIFVRETPDGKVDPKDSYQSDWIGTPSGGPTRTLDAKGAKVIGVHGRRAAVIDAIGLVTE